MELFYIYLWLKLDIFRLFFLLFFIIPAIPLVIVTGCYYQDNGELYKHAKKIISIWLLMLFMAVVLPSQKDTAILVGSSYALDMARSPEGVKVQSLLRKKVNEYLDEQLKEVKK